MEAEQQLFEYYGVEAEAPSEKKYSTYFYTNGRRKLGATSEQLAEISNIQGKKCIAERKTTAVDNDPAATATIGFVLCVENSRLIRMSRKSKEIELAIPVESIKVEIKIYAESSAEDTYFLKFEKRKNIEINGKLYPEVIVREKKIFSDKSGKTLFAITKAYFVKKIGMVYEVSYSPKDLNKPIMATVLNEE